MIITYKMAEKVIRGYARLTKTSAIAERRIFRMQQALEEVFNIQNNIKEGIKLNDLLYNINDKDIYNKDYSDAYVKNSDEKIPTLQEFMKEHGLKIQHGMELFSVYLEKYMQPKIDKK